MLLFVTLLELRAMRGSESLKVVGETRVVVEVLFTSVEPRLKLMEPNTETLRICFPFCESQMLAELLTIKSED
jgi:hypothetical protein